MSKQRLKSRRCCGIFVFILIVTAFICSDLATGPCFAEPARYRVFSLKKISAERGKEYLSQLQIGTVSQLPSPGALLITALPIDLIKATALLKLVDIDEQFIIRAVSPASDSSFPLNSRIEQQLGDITIGTFTSPPLSDARVKAIIDTHNDNFVLIAPAAQTERIISTIKQLKRQPAKTKPPTKKTIVPPPVAEEVQEESQTEPLAIEKGTAPAEDAAALRRETVLPDEAIAPKTETVQPQTNEVNGDELFSELLKSLAEAEQKMAELDKTKVQPKQSDIEPPAKQSMPQVDLAEAEKKKRPDSPIVETKQKPITPKIETPIAQRKPEKTKAEPMPSPEEFEEPVKSEAPTEIAKAERKVRSYKPKPIPTDDEVLKLNLPEKLQIIDLLDLVGKHLDLDYMYDPAQVKGEVALRVQGPIKVSELYPLAESVLKFRGFVMARKGNLVTIVPVAKVLEIDPLLLDADSEIRYGDVIITRIFQLAHIDTMSAKNLLDGMKLGANITPVSDTGTLIVTAFAYRMGRIEELLQIVDRPGEPKEFRFRQLKYTMAESLAPKIKTLAEHLGTVSVTVAAPSKAAPARSARARARARAKKPAPTPAKPGQGQQEGVYLDADERTNRILMIGLEGQLAVVDTLIDSLDVEKQDLRAFRLYEIQHVGAEEVLDKLNELGIISTGAGTRGGRSGRITSPPAKGAKAAAETAEGGPLAEEPQIVIVEATNALLVNATSEQHIQIATIISYVDSETLEQAIDYVIYPLENQDPLDLAEVLQKLVQETVKNKEGKIEKVVKRNEDSPIIVADENTFSIIVYASKKDQKWIGSLIKNLDKRRPQVLIDVTLVAITSTDKFQYDLDLVTKLPSMNAGGFMEVLAPALLKPFSENDTVIEGKSVATGQAEGFYADRHIQALLTLMQTNDYGRVLSKPKILVNDNEEGTIDLTSTTYVSRSSSTTTTTGDPILGETTTFDEFSSGINLAIKPHISEGDLLRLEIELVRSVQESASGELANTPPPDKTENTINTVVTVPDNSTIILGGILQVNQSKDGGKVPILGDLPLIGGLFRSVDNSDVQTKLYIFVKANILRPKGFKEGLPDLERISERSRLAFEKSERKFQEYEQMPGESEAMDPLRVLEFE